MIYLGMIDEKIHKEAVDFIKQHKQDLINRYILGTGCRPVSNPVTYFMAGSPGAGKTEFSKNFVASFFPINSCVRIDADDIREMIPCYDGKNSHGVQSAACLGVEKLYDYILKNKFNALVDGTLASYNVAEMDIRRSLKRGREVGIFYIYQDPIVAWNFTKIREEKEGRAITKDVFINALFQSKENVDKLKSVFQEKIKIFLVEKNYEHKIVKFEINIGAIDKYIKIEYSKESLGQILDNKI